MSMEFRLLIRHVSPGTTTETTPSSSSEAVLSLAGHNWILSSPLDIEDESLPEYACISYLWGPNREANALFPDRQMSTHTIPSLAAAMRSQGRCDAFWTDIFCVPQVEGPARQATLENLGYIYARATEVVVVLGARTFSVLQDMVRDKFVSKANLQVLDDDQWISSIWTYQEVVNASAVRFVSEAESDFVTHDSTRPEAHSRAGTTSNNPPSIDGSEFLNALGHGLMKHSQSASSDIFTTLHRFPNLDVLENVLVDWMTGPYTQRSALSIFSNISSKHNSVAANYFYAILGALTDSPQRLVWSTEEGDQLLAEKMMQVCESKNDFSFIYTVADRDSSSTQAWRPRADPLPANGEPVPAILRPIFAWHIWGESQSGSYNDAGELCLHNMTIMYPVATESGVNDEGNMSISRFLNRPEVSSMDAVRLADITYRAVLHVGFEGQATPITVTDGLIYVLNAVPQDRVVRILVSNDIRFSMGAPGMVHFTGAEGEKRYTPCFFIGSCLPLQEPGESVLL